MAFIIEEIRPAFRIAENTSRSGEPPDAISAMVFRPSGGRIGLPRAVGAPRTGRKGGKRMGRKKSHGALLVDREQRALVFALCEKSVSLAEKYSTCRLKAPSTASPSSSQTGREGGEI